MDEPYAPDPGPVPAGRPPAMPPLGPPYAPPGTPPPPTFPPGPPPDWPATPHRLEPPAGPPPATGGGTPRVRGGGDPQRRALILSAIGAAVIVVVAVLAWGDTGDAPAAGRQVAGATSVPNETATDGSTGSTDASSDSTTDSSTDSSSSQQDLHATVLDIEAFVERERGLPFQQDVDVRLATDSELEALLADEFAKDRPSVLETQDVLRATGLVSPTYDVVAAEQTLLDAAVLGFYDPTTKQLVVRGTEITPFVRETLAHELTHALDDQWFGLDRPQLDTADDETGFAFTSLAEGDAVRVQRAYLASLGPDERADAANEEQQLLLDHPELLGLPDVLVELTQEPYIDGPFFVRDVLDAGGEARLDAAFREPPTTSEQILDTGKFLAGEGPVPVDAPSADGVASQRGALGALLLRQLLRGSVVVSEVDAAIDGWGGDRYVTWSDASGRTCLRDVFVGDTAGDTVELARAIGDWARGSGAIVDAPLGQPGTFTVCS